MKIPKRFSPKRLFRSKKNRADVSRRSDPPSFGSATSSSSSSSENFFKPQTAASAGGYGTPTSVLPDSAADWSENNGVVSRKELEAILHRIGADPPSEEEVAMMLGEFDGDGFIRLEALMDRVGSGFGPACEAELREAFEFFDADHDGRITAEELHGVFSSIGDERCTLEDCRRMIADVDENGDGFVCFSEFVRMMELQG
ncbi:probable calcium-binding protein CML36 [Momordica charantia]|uniref:Probable calcium-binding protein CML36 n=1 Tax=Momordica charantia TaxID=3673 RepID=A0A6J1DI26_MOMCH|nr:probable calcium-binding protein CML36 [Momordica charantia]